MKLPGKIAIWEEKLGYSHCKNGIGSGGFNQLVYAADDRIADFKRLGHNRPTNGVKFDMKRNNFSSNIKRHRKGV
jgi:hypothetical protein